MRIIFIIILCCVTFSLQSQNRNSAASKNLVYVDKKGVLRWTKDNTEAAFFGVNYTTPFAYAYRAHKAIGFDLEKAIREDVYHMARLGLDAFRVHVWDTEISDTLGNLIENDHLRLFDFLLAELKKRNIKTLITPIAFWGNGYPQRDEATPGFSRKYGKGRATSNDSAIAAQENYLSQLFKHVNPYTHLTYTDDPDVIAMEINNEPSHSGPKEGVTGYINRLAAAVRNVGWTKPIYYNISQSPYYADAVAKSNIDGVSFQWYPTGLVSNQEVIGNFLPNVDAYTIPFDTIPAYLSKSRMVYEFDAADVLQSCMYPAMARSFRQAGFQWATQFAYDPIALAYANTEYQTHYLNLAYTPSKAISLMIASKAFHRLPRLKSYGSYPADSLFDVFRVSYKESLSEMNTDEEFYYSNSTVSVPKDFSRLKHIAGVGNSQLVYYAGTGAYFLDKLEEGVWRLEVMPDAVYIRDPFEHASPSKEVTYIQARKNRMQVHLVDLKEKFSIKGLNEGNSLSISSSDGSFLVEPGTYLLTAEGKNPSPTNKGSGPIALSEFAMPPLSVPSLFARHEPLAEVSAGKTFTISATVVRIDTGKVTLVISRFWGSPAQSRIIQMVEQANYQFSAQVPAELVTPGLLTYRIILQRGSQFAVFPGNVKQNAFGWDYYGGELYTTYVADASGKLEIFNATLDKAIQIYPPFKRGYQISFPTSIEPHQLVLRQEATELSGDHILGFQWNFKNKIKGRSKELDSMKRLVIRARTTEARLLRAKVTIITNNAVAYSAYVTLNNQFENIEFPLAKFSLDSALILPRPYPGFLPLMFNAKSSERVLKVSNAEKIEVSIGSEFQAADLKKPVSIEVASIWLEK